MNTNVQSAFHLPRHLHERARWVGELRPAANCADQSGDCILYWMRTALRVDENPALDVALHFAQQWDLPLLVYQGLSEKYPYASDRHHYFIMEAAAELQQQFIERGITYAFHLERPGHRGPYLRQLAERSAVVVTEDMPTSPPILFRQALQSRLSTPLCTVDTACVCPMQLVGRAVTRAFEYRNKTKKLYAERVTRGWSSPTSEAKTFPLSELPFCPIDLRQADLGDLIASCAIDHMVGPVADTPGGSSAGYQRWESFKKKGLRSYAKRRNDPLTSGVSRLSPYLHYGMIAPTRIAREAAELDTAGSEKYLDELLIWREMAYAFCFYRHDHQRWTALPEWARETLDKHATDTRGRVYSWEQLARGETDDRLWNAAQKSLLLHGELHNNVRMTWGKAILDWTADPRQALQMITDLNHRYALDGRDPASYGGILWCLGQFDRPFSPEQPVLGTVRPRPTEQHARRLDVDRYWKRTTRPRHSRNRSVAVLGAGISGLVAARTLVDHGFQVQVFEKSRGCGGRMSTRLHPSAELNLPNADHGAMTFRARDPRFRRYVRAWQAEGLVQTWQPSVARTIAAVEPAADRYQQIRPANGIEAFESSDELFVAAPNMHRIGQHLAHGLDVHLQCHVQRCNYAREGWYLHAHPSRTPDAGENGMVQQYGPFDYLVSAIPAPQVASLLEHLPELARSPLLRKVAEVNMQSCWTAIAWFDVPLPVDWQVLLPDDSSLSHCVLQSSKAGRVSTEATHQDKSGLAGEALILHATGKWSEENLELSKDAAAENLLRDFWRITGLSSQQPLLLQGHRWRYAYPGTPLKPAQPTIANAVTSLTGAANGPTTKPAFRQAAVQRYSDVLSMCDPQHALLLCGDWVSQVTVGDAELQHANFASCPIEAAFLSGASAAGRVMNWTHQDERTLRTELPTDDATGQQVLF